MSAKFAKYWFVIKVSLTAQLSYFWDLAGRSLFFVLILLIFHQLWGATLEDAASDLSRNQLIWYLAAAEVIMLSTPSGRGLNVDEDIKSGNIAYLLNRPCSYPLFMFGRYWGEALASLLVNAIIGSLTALALVGAPSLNPAALPALLILLILAVSLKFFLSLIISLTAFWVEESGPFHWIYGKLLFTIGGLFIPLEFFPGWLQQVSKALPFHLILYAPARMLVDWDPNRFFSILGNQALWLAAAAILAQLVFQRGVKKLNVHGG
jgi:ABC-2 type transport system permease protein